MLVLLCFSTIFFRRYTPYSKIAITNIEKPCFKVFFEAVLSYNVSKVYEEVSYLRSPIFFIMFLRFGVFASNQIIQISFSKLKYLTRIYKSFLFHQNNLSQLPVLRIFSMAVSCFQLDVRVFQSEKAYNF